MPQPGSHFGDDQFGQRGFIPSDFRPSKVNMNAHWMAAAESSAKTKEMTLLIVEASTRYRPEFHAWLTENYWIWDRFRHEADKIRATGRKHYGARTIAEYIRHETALREAGEFKLNDHATPDLARLYMEIDSTAAGFFELRARP